MADVPCGSCRLCCKKELVTLHLDEGDRLIDHLGFLDSVASPIGPIYQLKHKENDDCIYLGDDGCTIYERRPVICRTFDCRVAALKMDTVFSRKEQKAMARCGLLDPPVQTRGLDLLNTLSADERRRWVVRFKLTGAQTYKTVMDLIRQREGNR